MSTPQNPFEETGQATPEFRKAIDVMGAMAEEEQDLLEAARSAVAHFTAALNELGIDEHG